MTPVKASLDAPTTEAEHEPMPRSALMAGHDASAEFAETVREAQLRLEAVGGGFARLGPPIRALRRIEAQLRRPLRLALLGEFNSGKSTLANLIIGNAPLPTLQISNTRIPTLIHYSPEPVITVALPGGASQAVTAASTDIPADTIRIHVGMPMPHLRACEIIDFPGLSDPWLTYGILDVSRHPVDAAIWCTFSTQAWKESESTAWHLLSARIRANSMLVVTNQDLLAGNQIPKVMARLHKVASPDFSEIALLSSIRARKALSQQGEVLDLELWRVSGAADFCCGIQRLLSAIRRDRLKRAKDLTSKIAASALDSLQTAGTPGKSQ